MTENTRTINTTAGNIEARLVVYRDFIGSNGKWRLFWEDVNNDSCGFQDESTVTGQPFFNTKKSAIARGIKKYNIEAVRRFYHD